MREKPGRGNRPPDLPRGEVDVDKLLAELHEKKRWLDTVINGLEAAMHSPHLQLIEQMTQIFERFNGESPKVDLQRRHQRLLADLARQVGGNRIRRKAEEGAQAA